MTPPKIPNPMTALDWILPGKPNNQLLKKYDQFTKHDWNSKALFFNRQYKQDINYDWNNITVVKGYTRKPHQTLRDLREKDFIAGVVLKRDGYPEINLAHDYTVGTFLKKRIMSHFDFGRPLILNIDEDKEEFLVSVKDIIFHNSNRHWPFWVLFERHVKGQPTGVKVNLMVKDYEQSNLFKMRGNIERLVDTAKIITYDFQWPKYFQCDLETKVPSQKYNFYDLEQDLKAQNFDLHPDHRKLMKQPIFRLLPTVRSSVYHSFLKGQARSEEIMKAFNWLHEYRNIEEEKIELKYKMFEELQETVQNKLKEIKGGAK